MEGDVGRWTLEFLLSKPLTDTNLIKKVIRSIPVLDDGSRLKKTILLKTLHDHLFAVSITESVLETLELLEELLRLEGSQVTASMSAAYCAVALECTLKYLQLELDNNPKYLNAVKRIWRGRVRCMEPSANASGEGSLLFSAELNRWRGDIEASLSSLNVRKRLASIHTRRDAIHKLKTYLTEAWPKVGPSFVELAASMKADKSLHHAAEPPRGEDDCSAKPKPTHDNITQQEETVAPEEIQEHNDPYEGWCTDCIPSTYNKVDSVPNCEVQKVRESSGVENPPDDSLHASEEPPIENRSRDTDVNNEDNMKERTSVPENDNHRPSMMEKNSTACTYEGGPSNNADRFHLPSPKRTRTSPLKKYEPAKITKRRKPKKWSLLEEETLRTNVDKFGKGNWKLILYSHRDIFEERTEVDLKDKWRNMVRYGCK
ncbi:hypothetical protein VNO77_11687 [Canavalia gladiata]|uniref:Telomeric repeat binding factor 1 n=1 Tax=Canavalia gladiata TaxID=3824 RepID=A0AAN9MC71_CANGL